MKLLDHPIVKSIRERQPQPTQLAEQVTLDTRWLRQVALDAGADDVGFVEIDRPEIADQRHDILALLPRAKTLLSLVCRTNREDIRAPARSVGNLEFHHVADHTNEVARRIVTALERLGVRAVNPSMGFPMEMDRWGEKIWVVSHKLVAVAAGLGHMGIHRNVIHPRYGSFILLGTVVMDAVMTEHSRPIDYNPCVECKLCVAACPTGAIGSDGVFNFSACSTHNYREFMGGFVDWVEGVADSSSAKKYRQRTADPETVSMWQSLSFGANYKAAYCLAVCPAGEDVMSPFLADREGFLRDVVRPLQEKPETIYAVAGSDAEGHVARRFPNKKVKRVRSGLRPRSIQGFLGGLSLTFQRGASKGLDATYHFTFTGSESRRATVMIRNQALQVLEGHAGRPNLRITADSRTWLRFVGREQGLVSALLLGRIRLRGSPRWLLAFGRCFPS